MVRILLQNALVVGGVLFFFLLLRAAANRPARRDPATGELVLRFSPFLVWSMGAIAVGGPVGMGILSFVIPFKSENQVFVPILIGLSFLLLGGLLCLYTLRRRTRLSERGLTSEYLLARPRFLAWEHVVQVNFSSGQEFLLHG